MTVDDVDELVAKKGLEVEVSAGAREETPGAAAAAAAPVLPPALGEGEPARPGAGAAAEEADDSPEPCLEVLSLQHALHPSPDGQNQGKRKKAAVAKGKAKAKAKTLVRAKASPGPRQSQGGEGSSGSARSRSPRSSATTVDKFTDKAVDKMDTLDPADALSGKKLGQDLHQAERTLKKLEGLRTNACEAVALRARLQLVRDCQALSVDKMPVLKKQDRITALKKVCPQLQEYPPTWQATCLAVHVRDMELGSPESIAKWVVAVLPFPPGTQLVAHTLPLSESFL